MIKPVRSFGILALLLLLSITQVSANTLSRPTAERDTPDLFVKAIPTGEEDCSTWTDACDLQYALVKAGDGMEIWVAAGIHKPHTTDRTVSFVLINGVRIYGGFPAAGGTWEQRDWQTNKTYLSGDIGTAGVITDNSYRVVTAGTGVGASTILDGFYIVSGNANGATNPLYTGGGMYCYDASPTLNNIQFGDNRASQNGAGMANYHSSKPSLTNVYFTNNIAAYGGGMFNSASSDPSLSGVTFNKNTANENGGGMYNVNNSRPSLYNVTFESNLAHQLGGGMFNSASSPSLDWVQFTSNQANEHGGGMFNYNDSNPKITNTHFTSNTTSGKGGGMYNDHSHPDLLNVYFDQNEADYGGGIFNSYSSPNLIKGYFSLNDAEWYGGSVCNVESRPSFTDTVFAYGSAAYGGGVYNWTNSQITFNRVSFIYNVADEHGGGFNNFSESSATFTNVTFFANEAVDGGGIYNDGTCSIDISNATLTSNIATTGFGAGFYNAAGATMVVTSSIVWDNTPDEFYASPTGVLSITYSDIDGGFSGTGNINQNPLLESLAWNGGDTQTCALTAHSPAIDTVNPIFCPTEDQRGYVRPIDGNGDTIPSCDMGAYEYGSYLMHFIYLPLTIR